MIRARTHRDRDVKRTQQIGELSRPGHLCWWGKRCTSKPKAVVFAEQANKHAGLCLLLDYLTGEYRRDGIRESETVGSSSS